MKRVALLLAGAVAAALPLFAASAALPETDAVLAGAAYLKSVQRADGTYGVDSPGQNMDSIFAVRAAGYDPAKDLVGGVGPVQFLESNAAAVDGPPAAAKAALGAKALGLDPTDVAGVDFVAIIQAGFDAGSGVYEPGDDFSQSIAMLGLACTGNEVPDLAAETLQTTQLDSGGWGFGGAADPDTTAIAAQALLAAGIAVDHPSVRLAYEYLVASQQDDGGWGYDGVSNASSTAFVVQALIAMGEDPEAAEFTKSGVTPVAYLLTQQQADGSFLGFDPTFATNQVVPALAGRTFCNAPETPITRTRPAAPAEPTPTATVPAQASPTATHTAAAPLPPNAGNAPASTGTGVAPVLPGIVLLLAGGATVLAASAARRR